LHPPADRLVAIRRVGNLIVFSRNRSRPVGRRRGTRPQPLTAYLHEQRSRVS